MIRSVAIPEYRSGRRRRFSKSEKLAILGEAAERGESVSALARRSGLGVSLLFRWRKELADQLPAFMVADPKPAQLDAPEMATRMQSLEANLRWLANENRRLWERLDRFERVALAELEVRGSSTLSSARL